MKKLMCYCFCGVVLLPCLAFLIYDLCRFLPYRHQINALIAATTDDEKNPSAVALTLFQLSHQKTDSQQTSLSYQTANLLTEKLGVLAEKHTLDNAFTKAIWMLLIDVHLSTQEQTTLLLGYAPMGQNTYGYSAAALRYFHKTLKALTPEAFALLIGIERAPSRYLNNPQLTIVYQQHLISIFTQKNQEQSKK